MKYFKFLPFYFFSILPLRILYFFSDIGYLVLYYIVKYRRSVVRENLTNSFPQKSTSEIIALEKKFYKHFCDVFIEAFKCLTINEKCIQKRITIKNIELIEEAYQREESALIYTGHLGNWEWFSLLPIYMPYRTTSLYKKLSNNYFDQLMLVIRTRYGAKCIESKQAYRSFVALKNKNEVTLNCIIGDQSPKKDAPKHWVNFLNQDTAFSTGAASIAKKMNFSILFQSINKPKRGYYEVEYSMISEQPIQQGNSEVIERYAKKMEETITQQPEIWLWSHKRWKLNR